MQIQTKVTFIFRISSFKNYIGWLQRKKYCQNKKTRNIAHSETLTQNKIIKQASSILDTILQSYILPEMSDFTPKLFSKTINHELFLSVE